MNIFKHFFNILLMISILGFIACNSESSDQNAGSKGKQPGIQATPERPAQNPQKIPPKTNATVQPDNNNSNNKTKNITNTKKRQEFKTSERAKNFMESRENNIKSRTSSASNSGKSIAQYYCNCKQGKFGKGLDCMGNAKSAINDMSTVLNPKDLAELRKQFEEAIKSCN